MHRRGAACAAAVLLLSGVVTAGAGAASSGPSPPAPAVGAAVLELIDVTPALQERTLIISGLVRNIGRAPVAALVIDASGFAPTGDLAGFGSDGIPWSMAPGAIERFQIFLPLGRSLVSNYTVTISSSRPRQTRTAAVARSIFPAFYRPLILSRVQVDVDNESFALTFRASAEELPVEAVLVTVNLLVRDKNDKNSIVLRAFTVEVPVGRPLRLRFAPLIIRVVSVTVTDVILSPSWTSP